MKTNENILSKEKKIRFIMLVFFLAAGENEFFVFLSITNGYHDHDDHIMKIN